MTREEASRLWPIVKAYSESKEIEFFNSFDKKWEDIDNPDFGCKVDKYRIKKYPRFRQFRNAQECFEEMKKHSDIGWLKSNSRDSNVYVLAIHDMEDDKLYFITAGFQGVERIESSVMLKSFTFVDGTPFVVKLV